MTDKEYDQLYESHWAKAVNLCKKLLGKDYDRDAEDCAQEVFMAAWKKRDKITSPAEQWINEAIRLQCLKLKELSKRYDQWGMPIDMERIMGEAK